MNVPIPLIELTPVEWQIVHDILHKHLPHCEVWAFGSRAKYTAKPYSDLDLAVLSSTPLSLEETSNLKEAFTESDLPWKVDIVDWASTQDHFKKIIAAEKIIVQAGMKSITSSLIETPSPQPSPKGRGSENQGTFPKKGSENQGTLPKKKSKNVAESQDILPKKESENVPESESLLSAAPLKERSILSPLPLEDKHLLSPLPLGEGQGEGQNSSKSIPTHIIQKGGP